MNLSYIKPVIDSFKEQKIFKQLSPQRLSPHLNNKDSFLKKYFTYWINDVTKLILLFRTPILIIIFRPNRYQLLRFFAYRPYDMVHENIAY